MNEPGKSALIAAREIQERAAAAGFDWPDAEGPRAKIVEELAELDHAVRDSHESGDSGKVHEELGDLLFAVVNHARHLGIEPEQALAAANEKFRRRFHYIEERLHAECLQTGDVGLARLDAFWNEAKRRGL